MATHQKMVQSLQAARDLPILARVELASPTLLQLIVDFEQKQTMGVQEFLTQTMDMCL